MMALGIVRACEGFEYLLARSPKVALCFALQGNLVLAIGGAPRGFLKLAVIQVQRLLGERFTGSRSCVRSVQADVRPVGDSSHGEIRLVFKLHCCSGALRSENQVE